MDAASHLLTWLGGVAVLGAHADVVGMDGVIAWRGSILWLPRFKQDRSPTARE